MYKCKYFRIEELVSRKIHRLYGEHAWRFLDPVALKGLDFAREHYGSCTINNWYIGGSYQYSGLRADGEYPISSIVSSHRHGKAFDTKFSNAKPEKVQYEISNGIVVIPGLTELELGTETWTHMAFNTNMEPVFTFEP